MLFSELCGASPSSATGSSTVFADSAAAGGLESVTGESVARVSGGSVSGSFVACAE